MTSAVTNCRRPASPPAAAPRRHSCRRARPGAAFLPPRLPKGVCRARAGPCSGSSAGCAALPGQGMDAQRRRPKCGRRRSPARARLARGSCVGGGRGRAAQQVRAEPGWVGAIAGRRPGVLRRPQALPGRLAGGRAAALPTSAAPAHLQRMSVPGHSVTGLEGPPAGGWGLAEGPGSGGGRRAGSGGRHCAGSGPGLWTDAGGRAGVSAAS